MEKMATHFGEANCSKNIQNGGLLCLIKYERVDNVFLRFHIIPIMFEFLVELTIHNG